MKGKEKGGWKTKGRGSGHKEKKEMGKEGLRGKGSS